MVLAPQSIAILGSAQSDSGYRNGGAVIAPTDPARDRYPYCLVYGPLPVISWILPFIGHLGICDSTGKVHDFAGSFYIGVDNFMVGQITRYYFIDPRKCTFPNIDPTLSMADSWDAAIALADDKYAGMEHNLFMNNCHHHASLAIRNSGQNVSMWRAWALITFKGRFVSVKRFVQSYLGFAILVLIIIAVVNFF